MGEPRLRSEYLRQYRKKNAEKIRQYKKEYYQQHKKMPTQIPLSEIERKKRAYECQKRWRKKNRERLRLWSKNYWRKHQQSYRVKARESYYRNRDSILAHHKQSYIRDKQRVYEHYSLNGIKCACCGCYDEWALSIDHIKNNGKEERREFKQGTGSSFYKWLIKNNFPDGYQVLCRNCNWGKKIFGECPHKMH